MTTAKKILIVLIVLICTGGALVWVIHRVEPPGGTTWEHAVGAAKRGNYELMHTDEIRQLLEEAPQKLVLIDLRSPQDYREGHIPGAINVLVQQTFWSQTSDKQRLNAALGPDKTRYAVLYGADSSCMRSDVACCSVVELGYAHVYRYAKGFADWKDAGLPVSQAAFGQVQDAGQPYGKPLVLGWALIGTLLGIFAGGVALNLTPCVYPLIPITISYFGMQKGLHRLALAMHGLLYVVGLSLTNSVLGIVAALTGSLMGSALQHPAVLVLLGLVLTALALSLFGYWEFRLPFSLTNWASRPHAGYAGSLFMGMTLGVVAAPCLGPFVLGMLTWVASMGSPLMGFLVFFMLSLGLGVPLFVLALLSGTLGALPASGEWMLWPRKLMGWVMMGMAAYFVGHLLPDAYAALLLAVVIAAASLHLGWVDRTETTFRGFRALRWATGLTGLVLAFLQIVPLFQTGPHVAWRAYSDAALVSAAQERKPVIMDFFASWCAPCRMMEKEIFAHPEVIKEAQRHFIMIKVDLTQAVNGEAAGLIERFQVKGVPTIIFLDAHGRERTDLRLVGAVRPDEFLIRMVMLR